MEKEDRIRQKEQWKQLSPSEKWQYFIDYYLWVTIGVATGIVYCYFPDRAFCHQDKLSSWESWQ